ncbi:MAG TPA: HU family DNA-binding protein [Gemmataceae bacterium]|nr:HU family DNA-binding protein [Gemmataceae bacterium]
MRTRHGWALGGLCAALALMAGLTATAQPPKAKARGAREETLPQRVARRTKLSEENVNRIMQALGPAIREELARGREVSLPGLGSFRVVRVEAHRDLGRGGRPVVVPAVNTVEFLADSELDGAANSAGARPAETVPGFHYVPLPDQTPGQKVGPVRTPGIRTP